MARKKGVLRTILLLAMVLAMIVPAAANAATSKSVDLGAYASAVRESANGDYVYCDVFAGSMKFSWHEAGSPQMKGNDKNVGVSIQEVFTQGTTDESDDVMRVTYGYVSGYDAGITKRLTGAKAVAVIDAVVEEYMLVDIHDPDMNEAPVPFNTYTDTITVNVNWVGTGALMTERFASRISTPTGRAIDHRTWTHRAATVSGSVVVGSGRLSFGSQELFGELYSSKYGSVQIGEPWVE